MNKLINRQLPTSDKQRFLVVDDHEAVLAGTVPALKETYPKTEILTAQDRQSA